MTSEPVRSPREVEITRRLAFAGRPAREPVRLYAGLESATSADARARLVVAEMDRTGAFNRYPLVTFWQTADLLDRAR